MQKKFFYVIFIFMILLLAVAVFAFFTREIRGNNGSDSDQDVENGSFSRLFEYAKKCPADVIHCSKEQ